MWRNNIENTDLKKSNRNLLGQGVARLKKIIDEYPSVVGLGGNVTAVSDSRGIIAYEGDEYILVAKLHPYGDIVSVSKTLWNRRKKIRMYLASNDAIYELDPKAITETKNNFRGKIEMVNFSVSELVNVERLAKAQSLNAVSYQGIVVGKEFRRKVDWYKDRIHIIHAWYIHPNALMDLSMKGVDTLVYEDQSGEVYRISIADAKKRGVKESFEGHDVLGIPIKWWSSSNKNQDKLL